MSRSERVRKKYIRVSESLIESIHKRDSFAILKMIIGDGARENKRGDVLKNDLRIINEYLDSIPDLKSIVYRVEIDKNNLINYAVVTIPLRINNNENFKIQIFFSSPDINPTYMIRNFEFIKDPKSYKLKSHPKIG